MKIPSIRRWYYWWNFLS